MAGEEDIDGVKLEVGDAGDVDPFEFEDAKAGEETKGVEELAAAPGVPFRWRPRA